MTDHDCPYAQLIGAKNGWQKDDETGIEVCKWCHEPKYVTPKVAKATPVKKVANVRNR